MSRARKSRPLLLAGTGLAAIAFGGNLACGTTVQCPCGVGGVAATTGANTSGSTGSGVQYCGVPDGGAPYACYPDGGAIPDAGSGSTSGSGSSGSGGTT